MVSYLLAVFHKPELSCRNRLARSRNRLGTLALLQQPVGHNHPCHCSCNPQARWCWDNRPPVQRHTQAELRKLARVDSDKQRREWLGNPGARQQHKRRHRDKPLAAEHHSSPPGRQLLDS